MQQQRDYNLATVLLVDDELAQRSSVGCETRELQTEEMALISEVMETLD